MKCYERKFEEKIYVEYIIGSKKMGKQTLVHLSHFLCTLSRGDSTPGSLLASLSEKKSEKGMKLKGLLHHKILHYGGN